MFTVTVKMSSRYMAIGSPLFSPKREGRRRRRRRQHHVDRLPRLVEVALDERAHLLRLEIIGVVVAGGEHVGADENAAAHLLAEAGCARVLVGVDQVLAGHAQAVAHAVIAREVGRSLGGRDDVVGRQRVLGVRQADVVDGGAGRLEPGDALLPQLVDLLRHALDAVLLRHADAQALDALAQRRLVVRHRRVDRG